MCTKLIAVFNIIWLIYMETPLVGSQLEISLRTAGKYQRPDDNSISEALRNFSNLNTSTGI